MCFFNSASGAVPKPQAVTPAPTQASVEAAAAAKAGAATVTAINTEKATVQRRQGTYGNVKTTPFGDVGYGTSTVAMFGKKAA